MNGGIPVGIFTPIGIPKKNVITNVGLNHVELLLAKGAPSTTGVNVSAIALGNISAPAVGDTTLSGEISGCGLDRAWGTYYDLGNGWWEINNTLTYSCSSAMKVNTTGNFNQTTNGVFFSGGIISDVNFGSSGDQIRIRHNFTYKEG